MLNQALLGLLTRGPSHGYELKGALERAFGGHWEINFGQLYTTLGRLERDGLVEDAARQLAPPGGVTLTGARTDSVLY